MMTWLRVSPAARAAPAGQCSYCGAVCVKAARLATSLSSCHATSEGVCEWVSARAPHTRARLGPQLATPEPWRNETKAAVRARQLAPFALASRLFSRASPRKSLLRREAPFLPARAADTFFGHVLCQAEFEGKIGRRASAPVALEQPLMLVASIGPAAMQPQHSACSAHARAPAAAGKRWSINARTEWYGGNK